MVYRTSVNVYRLDVEPYDPTRHDLDYPSCRVFQSTLINLGLFNNVLPGDLVVNFNMDGDPERICMIDIDGNVAYLDYTEENQECILKCITCPDIITPDAILDNIDLIFPWHKNLVPVDLAKFTYDTPIKIEGNKIKIIGKYQNLTYNIILANNFELANTVVYLSWNKLENALIDPSLF
jgi:hypothetical protein